MITSEPQFIVFTGLNTLLLSSRTLAVEEISPAFDYLRQKDIPLVVTTGRTAPEVYRILSALDRRDPFIVEGGGAIHIPEDALSIAYDFDHTENGFRVIEIGMRRDQIADKIKELREQKGFPLIEVSGMPSEELNKMGFSLTPEDLKSAGLRSYSELVILQGDPGDWEKLNVEIEAFGLRLKQFEDCFIITGDHDTGSAVRFLVQLYREEYNEKSINTIGLGSGWQDTFMLHAVDRPVLVRREDGRFDSRVGRRGLKFTRNPGPVGWNEAVLALLTGEE